MRRLIFRFKLKNEIKFIGNIIELLVEFLYGYFQVLLQKYTHKILF